MTNKYNQYSARECEIGEFNDLPENKKIKLTRMIARIMERAYRRGVQQGITMTVDDRCGLEEKDCYEWRYEIDLDQSVGIDKNGPLKTSSLERIFMEEDCLREIGFKLLNNS